ncbi:cytochrome C [Brevibacillus sp. SYSU BS000544]|uniref:cytochrome C n=1 Tax=Brevibacillus sp. SYSU BS000544 TaxID=3416443 RepID=UPI003CE4F408
MNKNLLIFFLCFAITFAGGYVYYQSQGSKDVASEPATSTPAKADESKAETPAAPAAPAATASSSEGQIFTTKGCIGCHSISALNLQGGAAGPDLSKAFVNVKDKHGVPIEEFLKKPTSAVMSGVIGGNPLTDEEREAILKALKLASEK